MDDPFRDDKTTSDLETWVGPAILLVDLDAFFASVEQLDHPGWVGKPVIVGGDPEKHGVVSTASYEARTFGVCSAMPSSLAKKMCPDAIWTRGNFDRYRAISRDVMEILHQETPYVQQVSIDEAFLNVTPSSINPEHPISIARRIQRNVAQLGVTCSVGLGTSKTVAKIASDRNKPQGLTVVYPGHEREFLDPLPVRSMSGIGASSEKKLHGRGIYTIGDLARYNKAALIRAFGKHGEVMHLRACGFDDSPVEENEEVKSVSHEITFAADLTSKEEVFSALKTVASHVARRMRLKGLRGKTLHLRLRFNDRSVKTVQRQLGVPSDDEAVYIESLLTMVCDIWRPGIPVRLLGVGMSNFKGVVTYQGSLFEEFDFDFGEHEEAIRDAQQKHENLIKATDLVKDKFGEASLKRGFELRNEGNTTATSSKNGSK